MKTELDSDKKAMLERIVVCGGVVCGSVKVWECGGVGCGSEVWYVGVWRCGLWE